MTDAKPGLYNFNNGWTFLRRDDGQVTIYYHGQGHRIDVVFTADEWRGMTAALNSIPKERLSQTQQDILAFVREYLERNGHRMGPTNVEIAQAVHLTPAAVGHQIRKLRRLGFIEVRKDMKIRGICKVRLPGEPL